MQVPIIYSYFFDKLAKYSSDTLQKEIWLIEVFIYLRMVISEEQFIFDLNTHQ